MKAKWQLAVLGVLSGLSLILMLPGCEGSSSPDTGDVDSYFANHPYVSDPRDPTSPRDLNVTPASGTITFVGQVITFTVTGGTPAYRWDVVNANGRIRSADGDGSQGIYNADAIGPNTIVVFDANGHSALANISTSIGTLAISPGSATLTNASQVVSFAASGGAPPYSWTLLNGHGSINTTAGSSVLYTRTSPPGSSDNGITVSDSVGNSVSAVITQP